MRATENRGTTSVYFFLAEEAFSGTRGQTRYALGNTLALLRAHPLRLPLNVSDTMALADGTNKLCVLLAKCIRNDHCNCLAPNDSSLYAFG